MYRFSPALQRIVASSLFLIVCAFIMHLIILPALAMYNDQRNKIDQQRRVLSHYVQVVNGKSQLENKPDAIRLELYSGKSKSIMRARLQSKLKSIVISNGAIFHSAQTISERRIEGLNLLGLQIRISGDFNSIHKSIYMIENTRPFLFIEDITLQRKNRLHRSGQKTAVVIDAQFGIYAPVQENQDKNEP